MSWNRIKRAACLYRFWLGLAFVSPLLVRALFGMWIDEKAAGGVFILMSIVVVGSWLLRSAWGYSRNIEIRSPDGYTGIRHISESGDVLVTFDSKCGKKESGS